MTVYKFVTSPLQTNTYLLENENNSRGFVVDPGGEETEILKVVDNHKTVIDAILLTHGHFDHIAGVAAIVRALEKRGQHPLVMIHHSDRDKISSYKNLAFSMGFSVEKFVPDIVLQGGETLKIAGYDVKVIHTPGHSEGGVCYIVKDRIFSGDTIFYSSYGRYDFYDGDFKKLKNSVINRIFSLDGEYEIYPGHGDVTKLSFEKKHNMILTDTENPGIID